MRSLDNLDPMALGEGLLSAACAAELAVCARYPRGRASRHAEPLADGKRRQPPLRCRSLGPYDPAAVAGHIDLRLSRPAGLVGDGCRRPLIFSSWAIDLLTLGWDVWRISAAAVVEPESMTARNAST
jgi:hypothetical protein